MGIPFLKKIVFMLKQGSGGMTISLKTPYRQLSQSLEAAASFSY